MKLLLSRSVMNRAEKILCTFRGGSINIEINFLHFAACHRLVHGKYHFNAYMKMHSKNE